MVATTMSQYLVRRITEHPRIALHTESELTALFGNGHLESIEWRNGDGAIASADARHVFTMTGADPCTAWLGDGVATDEKQFIKTGPELTDATLVAAGWPSDRPPYLLETSTPGVFAVGDVRSGNVKRVASAVGEGAVAVSLVHRVLQESRAV